MQLEQLFDIQSTFAVLATSWDGRGALKRVGLLRVNPDRRTISFLPEGSWAGEHGVQQLDEHAVDTIPADANNWLQFLVDLGTRAIDGE